MTTSVARTRDGALDGIRGFAALAVLFGHITVHLGLLPYAPLGVMGVLMFFALSGYLIATICWRLPPTRAAYQGFLRRRVVRLAPVITALVVLGGPLLVLLGRLPARDVGRDGAVALLQGTAFSYAVGPGPVVPFRPTWSLTVEWTFYLLFPLALALLRRRGASDRAVLRTLSISAALLYTGGLFLPNAAFYLLPVANLGVLVAGAALATWHRMRTGDARRVDPARTGMALLLLVILVVLPGDTLGWGWKAVVLPATTLATLLVIHGCWAGNAVSRALAWGPLRVVGLRAYSLYLWHLPVMWVVWVQLSGASKWVQAGVSLVVIVVLVHISFELLERPVLGSRLSRGRVRRGTVDAAGGGLQESTQAT